MLHHDLLLTELVACPGAIHPHGFVSSKKRLVVREAYREPHPDVLGTATLAAFEVHSAVVVDILFIVDDRAPEAVVAHHFGDIVHEAGVIGSHDDAEVVGLAGT